MDSQLSWPSQWWLLFPEYQYIVLSKGKFRLDKPRISPQSSVLNGEKPLGGVSTFLVTIRWPQMSQSPFLGLSFPICTIRKLVIKWPHIPLSVTVSDCRLCSYFRCRLWTSVVPTALTCQSGSDRGAKVQKRTQWYQLSLHFLLTTSYKEQLLRQTYDTCTHLLGPWLHGHICPVKEKKTILNNSGKYTEEDYFSSQTQTCIFSLILWIEDSWNTCILRDWMFFYCFPTTLHF